MQRIRQFITNEDVLNDEFKMLVSEINTLHEKYVKKFADIKTLIPKIEATIAALNKLLNDNVKIIPEVLQTETNRVIDEITAFIEDETVHDLVRMKEHHASTLALQKQLQGIIRIHERAEQTKAATIERKQREEKEKVDKLFKNWVSTSL